MLDFARLLILFLFLNVPLFRGLGIGNLGGAILAGSLFILVATLKVSHHLQVVVLSSTATKIFLFPPTLPYGVFLFFSFLLSPVPSLVVSRPRVRSVVILA